MAEIQFKQLYRQHWLAAVFLITSAWCHQPAFAWGNEAHQLVADLAGQHLQPSVAAEIRRLLSAEPGATMSSVASWADEHRSRADASWHYVNLPPKSGCRYVAERDCPGGACVVSAIERQLQVLASTAPDEHRLRALKYVIHLVGDVHQPLHAGHAEDRGGNTFQLHAFGRGTNLHALWDTDLVINWPGGISALRQSIASTTLTAISLGSPADWAEESCQIVEQDWFYPRGHRLDEAYATRAKPVVSQRISQAARRLAGLLNSALTR